MRYNITLKLEDKVHGNGVMHLIQISIETFSSVGDGIIIQPPVYSDTSANE